MTQDEEIKYLKSSGEIFTVYQIESIRDGGNVSVKVLSKGDFKHFYIHKDGLTIHTCYPLNESNKIQDDLFIKFFKDRIKDFIKKQEVSIMYSKNVLTNLNEKYDE